MEPLLGELAICIDPTAYLVTQDRAAAAARERYNELVDAAYDAADPKHRWEALHLVAHLDLEGCETVLRDSWRADPDSSVRSCAEALLFRVIVRDRLWESGKMDAAGFEAYLRSVREQTAQLRGARHAAPGAPEEVLTIVPD